MSIVLRKIISITNIQITISILLLSTLIFLIGSSRAYLGDHYTSDVIEGFLLAISYLVLYPKILKGTNN